MRWFGRTWDAPVNGSCAEAPAPLGEPCFHCSKPILEGDRGLFIPIISGEPKAPTIEEKPWHLRCFSPMSLRRDGVR